MIPKSFEESMMGGPTCACIGHVKAKLFTIDVGCLKYVVNVMLVWQNQSKSAVVCGVQLCVLINSISVLLLTWNRVIGFFSVVGSIFEVEGVG